MANLMLTMLKAVAKGKLNPSGLNGLERFMLTQLTLPDRVPTMLGMPNVVKALEEGGLRSSVKVIIGGAPVSQKFAEDIHADAYAVSAPQGVEIVTGWLA